MQVLEALYLQCCVWSVGAAAVQTPEAPERDRLDAFLKQCAGMELASGDAVPLGALPQQSLFSFFVDEDAGAWKARASASAPDHRCTEEAQLELLMLSMSAAVCMCWLLRSMRQFFSTTQSASMY